MTALAIAILAVAYVVVAVRTTNRRWCRDLPLLRDGHEHQWRSVPGSALDVCLTPGCKVTQLRRWTS